MKIGIIIRCCRKFGSSRYVVETSKHFVKNNELHIFTNNWDPLDKRVKIHKIPVISSNFYVCEASFFFFATLALKTHNFDVTLAQPTRYFSPDVAEMQFVYRAWANYKKKNNIPITLGDRTLPKTEKHNIRRAKEIIAISNSVKNEVLHYYDLPEEKVHVIHSGVNLNEFNPKNRKKYLKEIRNKHSIQPNELTFLFVGNPFHRKGLKYTIEALSKLKNKDFKLLVLGKDDPNSYIKLANTLGIKNNIIFVGLSPVAFKYYAASDIFLFPTLYEPFGLVILEAMAAGLPVVTSKLAGAAELIDHGKNGLWIENPKNPDEISKKLNFLVKNKKSRKKMGKEARKKAEKNSWERVAKQMLEVLEMAARK